MFQTKWPKLNLSNQTSKKSIIPNLPNQTYQTYWTKSTNKNLPNQTYQNQSYQTKPTKPNLANQIYKKNLSKWQNWSIKVKFIRQIAESKQYS